MTYGHWLGDTWIPLPSRPLEGAGLVPPCWVVRPDGRRIWVTTRDAPRMRQDGVTQGNGETGDA